MTITGLDTDLRAQGRLWHTKENLSGPNPRLLGSDLLATENKPGRWTQGTPCEFCLCELCFPLHQIPLWLHWHPSASTYSWNNSQLQHDFRFSFRKEKKHGGVCVCAHARAAYMCSVCTCVFACVWWQRMILGTLSTVFHLLRLGVSSVWLGWLTNNCQGSACTHLLEPHPRHWG